MTTLDAIGLVASVIAIFEGGYVIGVWRTNKRRKSAEDEVIANRLRQLLSCVEIKKVECDARELFAGQSLPICVTIRSKAECDLESWIGASIVSPYDDEFYDTTQDKAVRLEPGSKIYRRSLTIPMDVPSGEYTLYCAVWLGQIGDPAHSIKLHRLQRDGKLEIRQR